MREAQLADVPVRELAVEVVHHVERLTDPATALLGKHEAQAGGNGRRRPTRMNVHSGRWENHEASTSHNDSDAGWSP